jgi:hypothetical protein
MAAAAVVCGGSSWAAGNLRRDRAVPAAGSVVQRIGERSSSARRPSSARGSGSTATPGLPATCLDALQTRRTSCHGNPTQIARRCRCSDYADPNGDERGGSGAKPFAERCVVRSMQDTAKPFSPGWRVLRPRRRRLPRSPPGSRRVRKASRLYRRFAPVVVPDNPGRGAQEGGPPGSIQTSRTSDESR